MSFIESELYFAYKYINSPINIFPFPHLYVQDIFLDKDSLLREEEAKAKNT